MAQNRDGARRNPHHIFSGFLWAVGRAVGKKVPMEETAGVSFWGHRAGKKRMRR